MPDGSVPAGHLPASPRVGGIVPFTTTDFPGKLAAVMFLQGCPWRCAYCQNPHLIAPRGESNGRDHDWAGVVAWLRTRRGLLDAVVFSGGEPTSQASLIGAIGDVRALGFEIALHTAGAYPRRLEHVLPDVDWIGLDIKAPMAAYEEVTGIVGSGVPAFEALDLVIASGVRYEVRTTVHPMTTPIRMLEWLARELAQHGVDRWVLQPFRPLGCADPQMLRAAPDGAIIDAKLIDVLRTHVPDVAVRQ